MKIYIPIDYDYEDDRKVSLYEVVVQEYPDSEPGIWINTRNSEKFGYYKLLKIAHEGYEGHIEIRLKPIDDGPEIKKLSDNMPSMKLGIFIAIEQEIFKKCFSSAFCNNSKGLIITGSLIEFRSELYLEEIDLERRKLEAASKLLTINSNDISFFYVKKQKSDFSGISFPQERITFLEHNSSYSDLTKLFFGYEVKYFNSFIERNGVYEGISELTEEDRKQKAFFYRFSYDKNRLVKIESINGKNQIIDRSDIFSFLGKTNTIERLMPSIAIIDFLYSENLIRIYFKNSIGNTLFAIDKKKDSENYNLISIKEYKDPLADFLLLGNLFEADIKKIQGFIYERDDRGYIKKILYSKHPFVLEPQFDENGVFGVSIERRNTSVDVFYLSYKGEKRVIKNGSSGVHLDFDCNGNILAKIIIDIEGKPFNNSLGTSFCEYEYDEKGNLISERYYSKDKQRSYSNEGIHKKNFSYIDNSLSKIEFFSIYDNKRIMNNDGIAGIKFIYASDYLEKILIDEINNPITENLPSSLERYITNMMQQKAFSGHVTYITLQKILYKYRDGKLIGKDLTYRDNLVNTEEYIFDDNGQLKEIHATDADKEFDKDGRIVKNAYKRNMIELIENGKLVHLPIMRFKYNPMGDIECLWCEDDKGSPSSINGVNKIKIEYNYSLRSRKYKYYDLENTPVCPFGTYCSWEIKYSIYGTCSKYEIYYRDEKDNLLKSKEGAAIIECITTEEGYDHEEIRYSANRKIIARSLFEYDYMGNLVEAKFYDLVKNELVFTKGWKQTYDKNGLLVEETCIDENGNEINNKYGYSKKHITYDLNKRTRKIIFFNKDKQQTRDGLNIPGYIVYYDELLRPVKQVYIDEKGHEMNSLRSGFSKVLFNYINNYELTRSFYNKKGQPISVNHCYYQINNIASDEKHGAIDTRILELILDNGKTMRIDERNI